MGNLIPAESGWLYAIFSNPVMTPSGVLTMYLLIFARFVPVVSQCPFLGAKVAPAPIRIGFAFSLAAVILPFSIAGATKDVPFNASFVGLISKEIIIGFVLGYLSSIPFYMVQSSGILIDFQRGSSSMMQQDPTLQGQSSPLGILFNNILIVIFFQIGGAFYFMSAIFQSFEIVPPNGWISAAFFSAKMPIWQEITGLMHQIVAISIQLAAPSLVAILMAEAFLGIANRLAPQVQIAFLGMSLRSLLGLALLFLGWAFILKQMGYVTLDWLKELLKQLINVNLSF
ncbi:MAG: EscT/YscT/HrcT family type III secretion system export apparatus protein [Candidatus Algichlamydia australiensis]|nr:EscT/YscT/HrcT family type III secretion system export apparatus protein [Chlamydiales bacterium]